MSLSLVASLTDSQSAWSPDLDSQELSEEQH